MRSPVLFMVFNRPEQTAESFARIREAKPPRLYVAADGPRKDKDGEDLLCVAVRKIATSVDWPCAVKTLFRKRNLGCRVACSSAITWFFEHEPEGVIIEDDIVAHPDFFPYCDTLLEHYRDDPSISIISGFNFQLGRVHGDGSYYFSNNTHIWGWASWARTWKHYDPEMTGSGKFLTRELAKRTGSNRLAVHYMSRIFSPVKEMTWDFALMYLTLKHEMRCIMPNTPLTRNIGFGTGVHCRVPSIWDHLELKGMPEIHHPSQREISMEADMFEIDHTHYKLAALRREAVKRLKTDAVSSNHELLRMARAHYGASEALDEIEVLTLIAEGRHAEAAACYKKNRQSREKNIA